MSGVVRLHEPFYILSDGEHTTAPLRVMKQGASFGVFDQHGDIVPGEGSQQGFFHGGTRFLSRFELLMGRKRPLLLSSTISDDNTVFTANLTNPDVFRDERLVIPHGELHLHRSHVLWYGSCHERIRVVNYALHPIELPLTLRFDADFADIFEVRGVSRPRRGNRLPTICNAECVLAYEGLDGLERRTWIRWTLRPVTVEPGVATFVLHLESRASGSVELCVTSEEGAESRAPGSFDVALVRTREVFAERVASACRLRSSNTSLNRWLRRSTADLGMMLTDTPYGLYPHAGVPWFSTPFGRDGILTAVELLWAAPTVARGVLALLAATQATAFDDANDAQPGKILHEMRDGEMAALREVPFGRYYGTCDATPLFVFLADAYYRRTGDRAFIDELWPSILGALDWMLTSGDPDGDGFLEYTRRSESGLVHQGWKDSHDAVFHADGSFAEPPIAMCEVQGYAYAAWLAAARLAAVRGDVGTSDVWNSRAERLRERFEAAFWCEDLGTYALALDGDKRPCRVKSSNPGHCLFSGIVAPERAPVLASTLMAEDSFCGWGVRTIAAHQARFNPMSYHNGSVWPHDNAIIAAGLARYGLTAPATRILNAIFDLSQAVDLHRLPELICGFQRGDRESPTLYPLACAPQAWAAGAVYLMLQASLGLRVDAIEKQISVTRAVLPERIDWLDVRNLRVGGATVDLRFERHPHDVGVTVLRRTSDDLLIVIAK